MNSFAPSTAVPFRSDRRLAAILATVLVHAALILGWQVTRTLPPAQEEQREDVMQWLRLPPPAPALKPLPAPPRTETRMPSKPAPARAS